MATIPESETGNGKPDNRRRLIIVGVVAAALVACLCLVAVAVAVIGFDAFGLWSRLTGGGDPLAAAVPAGSQVYVQADFLQLTSEDTTNLVDTFIDAADDPDVRNMDDLFDQLDDSLDEGIGLTFTDDVQPWLGQYVGVAVYDFEVNDFGEPDTERWVGIIEVRDRDAADQFVMDLMDNLERMEDFQFDDDEYEGATIYEGESDFGDTVAISRSKSLLFVSTTADNIKDAIDAQAGESLSDDATFRSSLAALPKSRAMTLYVGPDVFAASNTLIEDDFGTGVNRDVYAPYQSAALSLSVLPEGLQMDVAISLDPDELNDNQLELLQAGRASGDLAAFLPEDTFGVVYGSHLDLVWESWRDAITEIAGADEFDDMMNVVEDDVGFNPDTDLFPILDGEWALAVYRTNEGFLAESEDVNIGGIFLTQTGDATQIEDMLDSTLAWLSDDPFIEIDEGSSGDTVYYELRNPDFGDTMGVFGTNANYLLIGTDASTIEDAFGGAPSLADAENYASVWRTFSGNVSPVLYLNIQEVLDVMRDNDPFAYEDAAPLHPVQALAVASRPYANDTTHATLIVFVESP